MDFFCGMGRVAQIGSDVWIVNDVNILAGVKIGNGAVIAAGAVVTSDILDHAIYGGVPARLIRYRFDPETVKRLLDSMWWDFPLDDLKNLSLLFDDVDIF